MVPSNLTSHSNSEAVPHHHTTAAMSFFLSHRTFVQRFVGMMEMLLCVHVA